MIICNNCGSPLDSESIFCKECGSPTPLAAQSAERPTRTPTQESLRPVLPEDVSAGSQSGSMQSARSSRAGDDVSFADIAGCFGCLILLLAAVGLGIYFLPGQTGEDVRSYFARILSIDPTPTPVPTPTPFPSPTPLPSPTPRSTPTTFPTATSTPSPPPQSEIDRILAGLDWGAASFNAPQSMNLGETRSIYLRVGATSSAGELEELIARELKRSEQEGERVESGRVRVADHMEARLTGPGFEITQVTPAQQAVSKSEVTEWQWEIKAAQPGKQNLHLTLSALLKVEGDERPRVIRTFSHTLEVNVVWTERFWKFMENNWQWLWTVVLVPVGAFLWRRWGKEAARTPGARKPRRGKRAKS